MLEGTGVCYMVQGCARGYRGVLEVQWYRDVARWYRDVLRVQGCASGYRCAVEGTGVR